MGIILTLKWKELVLYELPGVRLSLSAAKKAVHKKDALKFKVMKKQAMKRNF